MSEFIPALLVDALDENVPVAIQLGGRSMLVCRTPDGCFAVENQCSHAEQPLTGGRVRNGWIACPFHGARFDLASGEAIGPPATEPLQTFPLRIVDGLIEIATGAL